MAFDWIKSWFQFRVHHVEPVQVISAHADLYRQVYGATGGLAFGMLSDFSGVSSTAGADFISGKVGGTNLVALPAKGYAGFPDGPVVHAGVRGRCHGRSGGGPHRRCERHARGG